MPKSKKQALGSGLDGLFQINEEEITEAKKDVSRETLRISEIEPNRSQPRRNFDEDSLLELAESIKQYGVIQPIVVQKKTDKRYEIIAGERRWRAARKAGLREVPVVIKEFAPEDIFAIALIENIQREDLNPIEEAQAYSRLIEEYHLKQDELADKVSKNRTTITNAMRLLKLDQRVQQMLIENMLTGGHARALLSITDNEEQYNTALKVFDEKLSVRETEELTKRILSSKDTIKEEKKLNTQDSLIYLDIENRMKTIFGTKVAIKTKAKNKGRIEIEYYSMEELERLVELMNKLKQE